MVVCPPPRMACVMKKPRQNTNTIIKAPSSPGSVCGTSTAQKVRRPSAPKPRAASSVRRSIWRMLEDSGKTAYGTMKCTMPTTTANSLRVICTGPGIKPTLISKVLRMPSLPSAISQPNARTRTEIHIGTNTAISTTRCHGRDANTQQYESKYQIAPATRVLDKHSRNVRSSMSRIDGSVTTCRYCSRPGVGKVTLQPITPANGKPYNSTNNSGSGAISNARLQAVEFTAFITNLLGQPSQILFERGGIVVRIPVTVQTNLLGKVLGRAAIARTQIGGDQRPRRPGGRTVAGQFEQFDLRFRILCICDEPHGRLRTRRIVFQYGPVARRDERIVVAPLDAAIGVLLQQPRARIPDRTNRHIAIYHQLLAFCPRAPVRENVRLQFIELAQRARHVQRIQRRWSDAIREQCRLQHPVHPFEQCALARKSLDVPEIGPCARSLGTVFPAVPCHHIAEEIARNAIVVGETGCHLVAVDDRVVERLADAGSPERQRGIWFGINHVPTRAAACGLGPDRAIGRTAAIYLHRNTTAAAELLRPGFAVRIDRIAAPVHHDKLLALRKADSRPHRGRQHRQHAHCLDETAAADCALACTIHEHLDAVTWVVLIHWVLRGENGCVAFIGTRGQSSQAASRMLFDGHQLSHTGAALPSVRAGWSDGASISTLQPAELPTLVRMENVVREPWNMRSTIVPMTTLSVDGIGGRTCSFICSGRTASTFGPQPPHDFARNTAAPQLPSVISPSSRCESSAKTFILPRNSPTKRLTGHA